MCMVKRVAEYPTQQHQRYVSVTMTCVVSRWHGDDDDEDLGMGDNKVMVVVDATA